MACIFYLLYYPCVHMIEVSWQLAQEHKGPMDIAEFPGPAKGQGTRISCAIKSVQVCTGLPGKLMYRLATTLQMLQQTLKRAAHRGQSSSPGG